MSHVVRALGVAALALGGLIWASVSQAADLVSTGPYKGGPSEPGPCAERGFLNTISERFNYQVRHVPNLPNVSIQDFRGIHEHRFLPVSEDWPISRRYCGATVVLSDGSHRDIWYLIEGRMGFAGIGRNVEFCVSGFDRWFVYNGRCRVLR
jgi:capsid protein